MRCSRAVLIAAVPLQLLVGACSDDPVNLIDSPVVGSWSALSINADTLPFQQEARVNDVLCTVTLRRLDFTFHATGRYSGADDVRRQCTSQTQELDISSTFRGRWRVAGPLLYMTPERGYEESVVFSVSGDRLTITAVDEDGTESITVLVRQ